LDLCAQLSRDNQPRQDYLEFIKLSLLALDEARRNGDGNSIHFSPPGAYDRARWMAKSLKILLFREQFNDECQRTASSEKDLPSPCILRHGSLHQSPVMLLTMICTCCRAWNHFTALIAKLQKLPLK
jgi:hypothetical protein